MARHEDLQDAPTARDETAVRTTDPLAELSGEVAGAVREAWGRGPRKVVARWAGRDVLLVLMDDAHTDAERSLLATGRGDEVLRGRRQLHEIVNPRLTASAEQLVRRPVTAMLSATRLDPDVSAEIFLFAPGECRRAEPPDG